MDWTGTIKVTVYRFLLSYPPMSNNFIQTIVSVINILRNITLCEIVYITYSDQISKRSHLFQTRNP